MKIKYSYYSLRFPSELAVLCFQIQKFMNATYIDLPFLLPTESKLCEYRSTDILTYQNRRYYVANAKMDVYFKSKPYVQKRYFGVINISENAPEYVLWTTFYDEKIENLIIAFKGSRHIRIYADPMRMSATLKCDDIDV